MQDLTFDADWYPLRELTAVSHLEERGVVREPDPRLVARAAVNLLRVASGRPQVVSAARRKAALVQVDLARFKQF